MNRYDFIDSSSPIRIGLTFKKGDHAVRIVERLPNHKWRMDSIGNIYQNKGSTSSCVVSTSMINRQIAEVAKRTDIEMYYE